MDKAAFLEELRVSLHVLNENELTDIIEEYEQHIDLKVQKGLSEEQAIADFGNIKDLIKGIMDAYHLRIDEAAEGMSMNSNQSHPDSDSERESMNEESLETCANSLKNRIHNRISITKHVRIFIAKIKGGMKWIWNYIVLFFGHMKTWVHFRSENDTETDIKTEGNTETQTDSQTDSKTGPRVEVKTEARTEMKEKPCPPENEKCGKKSEESVKGSFGRRWKHWCTGKLKSIGTGLKILVNRTLMAAIVCIRICWNSILICIAGTIGILGLMTVYLSGICSVLLFRGYPIAGITIACFGMVLSLFSCMAFVWSLQWKKHKENDCVTKNTDLCCESIDKENREPENNRKMEMEEQMNA